MKKTEIQLEGITIYYTPLDQNNDLTVYLVGYLDYLNTQKASTFLNSILNDVIV